MKTLSIDDMISMAEDARAKETERREELDRLSTENNNLSHDRLDAKAKGKMYAVDKLEEQLKANRQAINDLEQAEPISFDVDLVARSWAEYLEKTNSELQAKIDAYRELKQQCAGLFMEIINDQKQANYAHFAATRLCDPDVWKTEISYNPECSSLEMPVGLPDHEARYNGRRATSVDALSYALDGMISGDLETMQSILSTIRRLPVKH